MNGTKSTVPCKFDNLNPFESSLRGNSALPTGPSLFAVIRVPCEKIRTEARRAWACESVITVLVRAVARGGTRVRTAERERRDAITARARVDPAELFGDPGTNIGAVPGLGSGL